MVMFWWAIGVCHLAHSYYHADFFFLPHSLLVFSCIKYHKLVWYICRKRNFVRIQHYSFAIFPFMVMMYLITSVLKLHSWGRGLELSLPLCHFHWCYSRGPCFPSWHLLQREVWELEILFYDHRSFWSSFISSFKIRMHSSLLWVGICVSVRLNLLIKS